MLSCSEPAPKADKKEKKSSKADKKADKEARKAERKKNKAAKAEPAASGCCHCIIFHAVRSVLIHARVQEEEEECFQK